MTLNRRIYFAVFTSWLSRFVTIGLGLVLIPVLFRNMGKEELGLWFMLGQSGAFLGLMDMGFSSTLTRRIAFAKGKSTANISAQAQNIANLEILDLVATGKVIYKWLTASVFILAWIAGFIFLDRIELHQLDRYTVWIAWTVMCLSHALGVWSAMWSCLLQGAGHVGWDALVGILIQVAVLVSQILAVILGGGLITLAIIAVVGALITRYSIGALVRVREPGLFSLKGRWNSDLFRSMLRPALKAWATGVGAFLILKTDQYFIAYFKGPGDIPSYQATYQVVSSLMTLALAFGVSSQVFISQLWQAGQIEQVHQIVQRNLRFGLIIMACGIAYLMVMGKELMSLWLGPDNFIGYSILGVFCITLFLEAQHVGIAIASRSTEDEAFVVWALSAGLLNLLFTWLLIKPYGLLGVALGTMIAQILTNNWYVVYRGLWRLRMSLNSYICHVLLPALLVLSLTVIAIVTSKFLLSEKINILGLLSIAAVISASMCATALWFLVLYPMERKNLRQNIVKHLLK